jgi:DNA-binding response OmpR family regulator
MMRVLIVEDEPLIAMSLAAELKLAGHHVLGPSGDAAEALCLAGEQDAELALIDTALNSSMDAVELARMLRAQCGVPSLFLTTEPLYFHEHADAALGMITLPFDPADITQTIQAAARLMRGDRPMPRTMPHALQLF